MRVLLLFASRCRREPPEIRQIHACYGFAIPVLLMFCQKEAAPDIFQIILPDCRVAACLGARAPYDPLTFVRDAMPDGVRDDAARARHYRHKHAVTDIAARAYCMPAADDARQSAIVA